MLLETMCVRFVCSVQQIHSPRNWYVQALCFFQVHQQYFSAPHRIRADPLGITRIQADPLGITRIRSEPSRSDRNPLGSTQIPSRSERIPSGFIIILFLINYFILYINHYTLYKYKYRIRYKYRYKYKYKNRQYLQLKRKS